MYTDHFVQYFNDFLIHLKLRQHILVRT